MTANKDTAKAINAATTLIKYCARYKDCSKCIFNTQYVLDDVFLKGCAINKPFDYIEIKEGNK
jgi:hypothetical protein